ncbi:hypothetical protein MASR2M8_25930 [Opitutaceae bacterium]
MKSRLLLALALVFGFASLVSAQTAAPDSRVYELRIYTTNAGRLPNLLSRFRDHTMRLFERHGMRNIGYFTPLEKSEGADTVLYYFLEHASREAATASWAAFRADPEWVAVRTASEVGGTILAKPPEFIFFKATDFSPAIKPGGSFEKPRVFELRRYTAAEGKLPALHAFFRNAVLKSFASHDITGIGFWDPTDADKGAGKEFTYLVAHPSREAATQAWTDLRADAYFVSARAEAYKGGNLTADGGVKSLYLAPVDFSPLK